MEPALQIPGYRIEAPIARGAQGVVYRATQLSLDRPVALKVVPQNLDETGARLLAKEAKVLAGLEHPNIVRVYDHGLADGCSYMAMELLDGVDLERHLDSLASGKPRPAALSQQSDATVALDRSPDQTVDLRRAEIGDAATPEAMLARRGDLAPDALRSIDHVLWTLEIASQLCEALASVHAAGVLHRDLKPANIVMVEGRGPVITDFGTVHAPSRASYTQVAGFVGTPAYMSPEQANERELDRRSDLYSLAATIYHCLAGRSPFAERSLTAVLIALERSEPEALRKINPAVPLAFAKVIGKGMAKDLRDRFADIGEFSAALAKVRRGERLGRLWTIPGLYRRTRRWHVPVTAGLLIGLVWFFSQDPIVAIRELIVADDLEQAVMDLGQIPMDERAEVDAALAEDLPEGKQEALARVLAVVDGVGLVRVLKSDRYLAAIGSAGKGFDLQGVELPRVFSSLAGGLFLFGEPGNAFVYMQDLAGQSKFSDGTARIFYCPMRLEEQGLREPLAAQINPADLPLRTYAESALLKEPGNSDWIEIPADSYDLRLSEKTTEPLKLTRPLIGNKFEVPRLAEFQYCRWVEGQPARERLFAHPDEPANTLALLLAANQEMGDDQAPLQVSYWAAFRLAGYLGGRLPSSREWLLAAQAGEGASSPMNASPDWPGPVLEGEMAWRFDKVWEESIFGFINMHTGPGEWTNTVSRDQFGEDKEELRYCFFILPVKPRVIPFDPHVLDGASPDFKHGLRLFRDRFPE